jgi:hypothetical protein
MTGIIEWTHDAQCAADGHSPLPPGPPRWADDYLHGMLFNTDKEYDFFAAVAGVRSRFGKPALIHPRGIPPHLSMPADDNFRHGAELAGWLTLSEIDRCIQHVTDGTFQVGFELNVALGLMRSLVDRLTDPHVRLVFDIESA